MDVLCFFYYYLYDDAEQCTFGGYHKKTPFSFKGYNSDKISEWYAQLVVREDRRVDRHTDKRR